MPPPLRLRIGPHERALFRFLEANGRITVSQFARLVRIPPRKASQILVRLTRAGLLQFHLEPTAEYFTLAGEEAR
jgi:DNA-binding IclR family transcriptional regulator